METLTNLLKTLVEATGEKQSEVAKKLGISAQRLGQYLQGRQKPKVDFYVKWQEVYGEDIQQMLKVGQTNVSRGTSSVSTTLTPEDMKGRILTEMVENKDYPYKLLPREFFDKYSFVPDKIVDRLNQNSDELKAALVEKYERYIASLEREVSELRSKLGHP